MTDEELIDALGGSSAVAEMCAGPNGTITPQAVSQWKTNGIPPARRQYLLAMHPEFAELVEPKGGMTE